MLQMDPMERKHFTKALAKWNERYDPEEHMIKRPFSSPGYHTTLKGGFVHPTRESLTYAVGLLDSGEEELRVRAIEVLKKVVSLQDTNPEHSTYGIWSWFYEEPLDKMSPPDWNWADFCGKELLQVALDHFDRLPEDVRDMVRKSIIHAVNSIMKRDVGPSYTNIAIMGTYVTLVAGELFGIDRFLEYGRQRLKRIYDHTLYHGAFTEYNSPTYTMVALEDLSRMLLHVKDPSCRRITEELHHIGWECVAHHFHAPTWQWAGPHSRCYSSLQGPPLWSRLELATGGRVRFLDDDELEIDIDWPRIKLRCPEEFIEYFRNPGSPRLERVTFLKGDGKRPSQVATTYLTPEYAIGSFNWSDLWNQRRALIAYWGTHERPSYMHLRCLHDGYDYASAAFLSVQANGNVLAAINFATDGGDTHPGLDRVREATIEAEDLRLRLEFGGSIEGIELPREFGGNSFATVTLGDMELDVSVPFVDFDGLPVSYGTWRGWTARVVRCCLLQGEEDEALLLRDGEGGMCGGYEHAPL